MSLEQRYNVYLSCADDGQGRDVTTNGQTYLKTFDQWLDDRVVLPPVLLW